jgi:hypothetical protein
MGRLTECHAQVSCCCGAGNTRDGCPLAVLYIAAEIKRNTDGVLLSAATAENVGGRVLAGRDALRLRPAGI